VGETKYPVPNPVGTITNLVVAHHIQQRDDVGPAGQILQDLDLALYLLLLDGLQDLDDAFLVVDDVDALEDLRVLSAPDLADDLVVLQDAPGDVDRVVVPVGAGHVRVDIGVNTGDARRARRAVERHAGRRSPCGRRRRASEGSGRKRGVGGWWWWGKEAEVGGTKQEERKASKHAERSCLVPKARGPPGRSSTGRGRATKARRCSSGAGLGGRRVRGEAGRELWMRLAVVQPRAACGCTDLAITLHKHLRCGDRNQLVTVSLTFFWLAQSEPRLRGSSIRHAPRPEHSLDECDERAAAHRRLPRRM
jgi:hypothetical protein